jgi:predicted dehydrogenase
VTTASPVRGVGVIGCGNIAMEHLGGWAAHPAGFAPVAVADPTPERLELGRVTAGLPPSDAYPDYHDLIARDDVAVVDVCVPPHVRREIVIAAARAGKHILSEKPLATVPADAAAMVEEANKAGVTLGLVHNYLFQPEIILARELIRSGAVGQVEIVIINYLGVHDYPGNPAYDPTWRHDLARSGGGIFIDIIHLAYLAEALLDRRVERVSAYANARTSGAGVEDVVSSRFETADSTAIINVGWSSGPDGIDGPGGIEVSGTDGRLAITYENGGTFAPFHELRLTDRAGRRVLETTAKAPQGTVPLAVQEFAAAIADDREPAAPGEDGQRTLEAVMAAYESAALGRTVALPLDRSDPLYLRGAIGLRELELPDWSPVRRKAIFGVAPAT